MILFLPYAVGVTVSRVLSSRDERHTGAHMYTVRSRDPRVEGCRGDVGEGEAGFMKKRSLG